MVVPKLLFVGTIVSPETLTRLNIIHGFLAVEGGKITRRGDRSEYEVLRNSGAFKGYETILMNGNQFLMPGFVDCHTHGPQYPNIGIGLDRKLVEWLDKYTFPLEKKFSDSEFAAKVYNVVVKRLLKVGTTTACYFGSLDLEGTLQLVENVSKYNQRALVGKVSMNIKNHVDYYNGKDKEMEEAETFVQKVLAMKNDLIEPIVTPRSALSCDQEMMTALSRLANKYQLMMQSHIAEDKGGIQKVLKNNPDAISEVDVFDKTNVISDKTIMAHVIHLTEEEMKYFSEMGVSVAHCPSSNTRLTSGMCPLRRLLNHGIVVGLGTDISGGDNAMMLDCMRRAMDVSIHLTMKDTPAFGGAISWKETMYLATLGGAKALHLDHKVGNFDVGKEFDALLIDVYTEGGAIDYYEHSVDVNETEEAESLIQRFIYLGDDRNIEKVYVKGMEVKSAINV